jgi:GNAT superfamily N-acetyltransferase
LGKRPPKNVVVRAATLKDLPVIIAYRRAMFLDMDPRRAKQIDKALPVFRKWVKPRLSSGEARSWLATVDGRPIGGAMTWTYGWFPRASDPTGRIGYILNVYVEPAWRRRGVARLLTQTCLDYLHSQGIRRVALHASNKGRPLYESLGFVATNEMRLDR